MPGFFSEEALEGAKAPPSKVPQCLACKLYKSCKSPKMPVSGKGNKKILLVGDYPGKSEDLQGKQFVGESGQLLENFLRKCSIDMRRDCWITNALICKPGDKIKDKIIDYCRPNLLNTINSLNPEVILLMGAHAIKSLIGYLWKEDPGSATRWAGWQIPSQQLNAWVCPTYNPAYVLRQRDSKNSEVLDRIFQDHLEKATSLEGRPWKVAPDYKKKVERTYSPEEASKRIKDLASLNKPLAFDFECDALKPESEKVSILCCSLSDGKVAITFPWAGSAIESMKEILQSDIPKIGANIKYETRWIRRKLKIEVNNWHWDTMLAMHVLDNRRGITGLKFQAFMYLGAPSYDDQLKPYMRSEDSNSPNRLREVSVEKLYLYCGLDSLYTHKIAQIQMGVIFP
jgi:uracil-DNA glycosylase family 4